MEDTKTHKKTSLKARMLLAFAITSLVPIIALNLFSYYNTAGIVKDNVNELTQSNLRQTRASLDVWTDSYEDILFQIYMNDDIVALIKKINRKEDLSVTRNQLRRTLHGLFYTKEYIKSITVITESNDIVFYDLLTGSTTQNSWLGEYGLSEEELYDTISADNSTHVFSTQKAKTINAQNHYLFHLGHRVINYKNVKEQLGIVVVSVDETLLGNVCSNNETDSNSYNFIADQNGNLVSYPDKKFLGEQIITWSDDTDLRRIDYGAFVEDQALFSGEYVTVYLEHDTKTGWDIINVSNQNEVIKRLDTQRKIQIAVMGVSLGMTVFLTLLLTKSLTGSIKKVTNVMKQAAKGDLAIRAKIDRRMPTEIETIATQFNHMLGKIKESVEKEKQSAARQREAEIAALEAQINPHFLYNTLDTINWMAIDKEEYEISNAIGSLAGILRYGIDNSNSIVTIRQECEWLKKYLFLQQTRLKNTFVCEIHAKPEVLDEPIHKLLLQPFVENAIIHGFEGIDREHELNISINPGKIGTLEICIYDNGNGMSKELVDKMNNGIFEKTTDKNCIGMENAITRISMYYGNTGNVKIESKEHEYTNIHITISSTPEDTKEKG